MDKILVIYAVKGLLEFILGCIVIFKNPRQLTNIVFFFLCLSFGLWTTSIGILVSNVMLSAPLMRLVANIMLTSGFMVGVSFYLFSNSFPSQKNINPLKIIWVGIPFLIIGILIFFTNFIIRNVLVTKDIADKLSFNFIGYGFFALFFVVNIGWGAIILIRKYIKSSGIYRRQFIYLIFGLAVFLILTAITNVLMPLFKNFSLIFLSPVYTLAFLISASYAILKYRLMDIYFVIKRTTLYLLLIAFVMSTLIFVLLFVNSISNSNISILIMAIASVFIAVLFQPLKNNLDALTDHIFFQKKYDQSKILGKASRDLSEAIQFQKAFQIVIDPLLNEVHVKSVAVYLREAGGDSYYSLQSKSGEVVEGLPEEIEEESPVVSYLAETSEILETAEFHHRFGNLYAEGKIVDQRKKDIYEMLQNKLGAGLVVPLILKKHIVGFMIIGPKLSGDLFSLQDISMLETLSNHLVTTIENIRMFEQMLNNERLRIIGTMSASVAHEIRNPLASIKTFVQMLPTKFGSTEFLAKFMAIVPTEIERLSNITHELLTFSKPSLPHIENIQLSYLFERTVNLVANQLRKYQVEIILELDKVPVLQGDFQQLTQVFLNLILNAMQASKPNSKIHVSYNVEQLPEGEKRNGFSKFLSVTVSDEGSGIKRKDLSKIFQPFFTTKAEGTGLGLANCKRIVEAHRGEILVESEPEKGTRFSVVIPMELTEEALKA